MTPLLAILGFSDYAVIAAIVFIIAGGASFAARQRLDQRWVERKLDALLKHLGVEIPSRLSPGVQLLATELQKRKTAAPCDPETAGFV